VDDGSPSSDSDSEALRLLTLLGVLFSGNVESGSVIKKKRLKRHHLMSKSRGARVLAC
jgi:large subunit ribosomal protein L5